MCLWQLNVNQHQQALTETRAVLKGLERTGLDNLDRSSSHYTSDNWTCVLEQAVNVVLVLFIPVACLNKKLQGWIDVGAERGAGFRDLNLTSKAPDLRAFEVMTPCSLYITLSLIAGQIIANNIYLNFPQNISTRHNKKKIIPPTDTF